MIRREQTAMELTQLRYFKALAEKGNLTKTAEALHLSAPALSVSIKRLEEELNTKLFDRRKGSALFLNDKGQIFLAEVSKALDCLDAAIKNIQETNHAKNSRLNLATSSPMLYQDLLVAFRLAHPDIYVSHAYLNLYQLAQKSQLSRFDCIIAAPGDIPQELLGDLCSCTLYRNDRPLVMVYPTHRFAARQSISLSELKGEAFIALEKTASSRKMFDSIFEENVQNRIIVATFASNVDRVQQIINSAKKQNRKVVIEGRSMVNIVNTAVELGYIQVPDNMIISLEEMKNYSDEQLVLITTGSQGEAMAALSRIAASIHRKIAIKPGDVVIFSSRPIPGNEKSVSKVINELSQKGAKVIIQDTHVSGHACEEEIKLIYSLVKPKFSIPVHGEYRHLQGQAEVAQKMGVPKENIKILRSGDILELREDRATIVGKTIAQGIMVDGLGIGDVGNIVLRDRQHLSENGLLVVVLTLEKGSNTILAGPDIVSRGFVYVREAENLMDECHEVVNIALDRLYERGITDWGRIKTEIKDTLNDFLWKKMKRNPVILPIIMEV